MLTFLRSSSKDASSMSSWESSNFSRNSLRNNCGSSYLETETEQQTKN